MFCIDGTKKDAILALQRFGISTAPEAEVLLDFIHSNPFLLNENECIEIEERNTYPQNQKMMGLVLCDSSYYINLKKTTIILAALLLDIRLTEGLAATVLAVFGFSTNCICSINERTGEKCVLVETLRRENKIGDPAILSKHNGKCCNPCSSCEYREETNLEDSKCTCTEDNVIQIYEELCKKNIFKKNSAYNIYHYQI